MKNKLTTSLWVIHYDDQALKEIPLILDLSYEFFYPDLFTTNIAWQYAHEEVCKINSHQNLRIIDVKFIYAKSRLPYYH